MTSPVLIIEDEKDLLELIAELLEMDGFTVLKAPNGAAALEHVQNSHPMIILCDEGLPDMSGHDVLAKVLQLYPQQRPHFFFCTGSVELTETQAKNEGAEGVISKPFNVDELSLTLKKLAV